jgi:hypothetical protein
MIATTKSTAIGKIDEPSTLPGVSSGAMMPRRKPAGSRSTSAGIFNLGATTWQPVAMPKTRTTARMICAVVGSDTALTLGAGQPDRGGLGDSPGQPDRGGLADPPGHRVRT